MNLIHKSLLLFIVTTLIASCHKEVINSDDFTVVKSYLQPSSALTDSIYYTISYNSNKKVSKININAFDWFHNSNISFNRISPNLLYLLTDETGLTDTIFYYTNYTERVDSIISKPYYTKTSFTYNPQGNLIKCVSTYIGNSSDTISFADYFYDSSNELTHIKEFHYSFIDSILINDKNVEIENSNISFPNNINSSFSFGMPFIFSNSFTDLYSLLYIYQTDEMPYNFGNRPKFLPKKIIHSRPTQPFNNIETDNFEYTIISNKIITTKDSTTRNNSIIKDVIELHVKR